jgi:hypothetical protein
MNDFVEVDEEMISGVERPCNFIIYIQGIVRSDLCEVD